MNEIDIVEQWLFDLDPRILELLLLDRTTKGNIKWVTDDYSHLGDGYAKDDEIKIPAIATINTHVIQPRVAKDAYEQERRRKNNAEVFTPAWICNRQNNMVDAVWFGRSNDFNTEKGHLLGNQRRKDSLSSRQKMAGLCAGQQAGNKLWGGTLSGQPLRCHQGQVRYGRTGHGGDGV